MRRGTTLSDLMQWDNTLFNGIPLPPEVHFETLVSQIMFTCGLQEVLYQDYDVFRSQVHIWFAANQWNIEKLVNLIKQEYEPLWNYNKREELDGSKVLDGTQTKTESEEERKGGSDTTNFTRDKGVVDTYGGTDVETETTVFGEEHGRNLNTYKTNTQTNNLSTDTTSTRSTQETEQDVMAVTAFNTPTWQDKEKHDRTLGRTEQGVENESKTGTVTDNETITETGESTKTGTNTNTTNFAHGKTVNSDTDEQTTETKSYNSTKGVDTTGTTKEDATTTTEERNHIYGNVGITTYQKMFMEEFELIGNINLYAWITNKFSNELMVGVYI